MGRFGRTETVFVVLLIVFCQQILSAVGDGGQQNEEEPPPLSKILTDTIALLKKSHQSSWEKVKAIINEMQSQFSLPNLDGDEDANGGGKLKEAAENSAKSAADMVEKTAEKVKNTVSNKEDQSHDEF